MSSDTFSITPATTVKEQKTKVYMHIAAQLAQVQSAHGDPLPLQTAMELVAQELSVSLDDVGTVYWELAHRGFFDLNGRPMYSLPTPE